MAWCRLDLVLLGSTQAADQFLAEYEKAIARTSPDIAAWDLQAAAQASASVESWAPNFHDVGRTDLTADTLRRRLNAWVEKW